jgi:hypothetical protein
MVAFVASSHDWLPLRTLFDLAQEKANSIITVFCYPSRSICLHASRQRASEEHSLFLVPESLPRLANERTMS